MDGANGRRFTTEDVMATVTTGGSERLASVAKRVTVALSSGARGKLVAALELMPLEAEWEPNLQAEAGGLTFDQWIGQFSGVRHQDWRRLFEAAELMGRDWDSAAAVWVANKFGGDEAALTTIKGQYRQEWKRRAKGDAGFPPLSLGVVRGFVYEMFGEPAPRKPRGCARCSELEALLRAAGVSVPEQ